MKILVINGANLNMLGKRDPSQYGKLSLEGIADLMRSEYPEISFDFFQSNIEGEIVNRIQEVINQDFDGLIINPGGYAHTSVVIRDALELLKIPKIEVHLSNVSARENFRQVMLTASVCNGYISGLKEYGYISAAGTIRKIKGESK